MTNICTKVTVRTKPIKNNRRSVYLDFYPAIRNPKNGGKTRREFLGIYIYDRPVEKFEKEYNKTMLQNAELIRCRRTEAIIAEDFGFLDRSKGNESFLEYFKEKMQESTNGKNWSTAYKHFEAYTKGKCSFNDLSVNFCQGFLTYMLGLYTQNKSLMMASTANNNLVKLKCVLRKAHEDGLIKENIAAKLQHAKENSKRREFLTIEEVKKLRDTPCGSDVVKKAALFSCLTGLRISDCIRLQWGDIQRASDGGWCMHIITKKTCTEAFLPISEEVVELCGQRGEGAVFDGLSENLVRKHLPQWLKDAGITNKHITFHCFRHTYATLQLAAGTQLYIISKMLTHSNLSTTQTYADVVSDLKREAADAISLKD